MPLGFDKLGFGARRTPRALTPLFRRSRFFFESCLRASGLKGRDQALKSLDAVRVLRA
jgi:hypothetical protein